MNIFLGIMIPFAGTALGAACVFLLKNDIRAEFRKHFWVSRPALWWPPLCGHF